MILLTNKRKGYLASPDFKIPPKATIVLEEKVWRKVKQSKAIQALLDEKALEVATQKPNKSSQTKETKPSSEKDAKEQDNK